MRPGQKCSREFSTIIVDRLGRLPFRHGRVYGKTHHKFGAVPHLTEYFHVATMLLDNLMGNGQTEPRTLTFAALVLRGIKRIKNMIQIVRFDSRPTILHLDLHPRLIHRFDEFSCTDGETATLFVADGLHRIDK